MTEISVTVEHHGYFVTRTDILDHAIDFYESSSLRTLQYTMWEVASDYTLDYTDVTERVSLIIMLCDVTFNNGDNHSRYDGTPCRFRQPLTESEICVSQHGYAEHRSGEFTRYGGKYEIALSSITPEFVAKASPSILRDAHDYLTEIYPDDGYTEDELIAARSWRQVIDRVLDSYAVSGIPVLKP
jgi:hypothetical protein